MLSRDEVILFSGGAQGAEAEQRQRLLACWARLAQQERFVFNKLITGAFRVGVSELLVVRALAAVSGVDPKVISHRLMGDWSPTESRTVMGDYGVRQVFLWVIPPREGRSAK